MLLPRQRSPSCQDGPVVGQQQQSRPLLGLSPSQQQRMLQASVLSLIIYVLFTSNMSTRGAEYRAQLYQKLDAASAFPVSSSSPEQQPSPVAPDGTCDRTRCHEAFYDGHWVHRPNRTRDEFAYILEDTYGCPEIDFRRQYPERTMQMMHTQFDWDTGSGCCAMHQFDADHFCDVLRGLGVTSILLAGDSITNLFTISFYYMMHGKGLPNWRKGPFKGAICLPKEGEEGVEPIAVTYVRNDLLYTEDHFIDRWTGPPQDANEYYKNWEVNVAWTPYLEEVKPDLLILNTGAHIHHPDLHDEVMRRLADYLKANYHGRLIWRTTAAGHPKCGDYFMKGPERDESKVREEPVDGQWPPPTITVWEYQDRERDVYTWHLFDGYNDAAVPVMRDMGATIIRADRVLRLRADAHVEPDRHQDCLHYWAPGPVDWLVVTLYQELEAEYMQLMKSKGQEVPWQPTVVDDDLL